MTMQMETEIMLGEGDFTVTVTYEPGWFTPGRYSGPPEMCYEDEGESPQVTSVTVLNGKDVPVEILSKLSENQVTDLEDACWEDQQERAHDHEADEPDDEPDWAYDYY